jgi:hypothetical protein
LRFSFFSFFFPSSLSSSSSAGNKRITKQLIRVFKFVPPVHLLLDSAPNLGPLISRWEITKFETC